MRPGGIANARVHQADAAVTQSHHNAASVGALHPAGVALSGSGLELRQGQLVHAAVLLKPQRRREAIAVRPRALAAFGPSQLNVATDDVAFGEDDRVGLAVLERPGNAGGAARRVAEDIKIGGIASGAACGIESGDKAASAGFCNNVGLT